MTTRPKGRPKKYAIYEQLLKDHPPKSMTKRPIFADNVGVFRGIKSDTVWIRLRPLQTTVYKGTTYKAGDSVEIKLGRLSSFTWEEIEQLLAEYQRKIDRGDPLDTEQPLTFKEYAEDWLHHAMTRTKSATNQYDVEKILLPVFGHKLLSSLSSVDIDRGKPSACDPAPIKESSYSYGNAIHNWVFFIGGIRHVKENIFPGSDHFQAA